MSWIASSRKELGTLLAVTILSTIMILPSFATMNIEQMTSNDLGIEAKLQRKDTPMLCLQGDPLTGPDAWDSSHESRMNQYCSQASISMIVSHYGGNLSQDRISYYSRGERYDEPPEKDLYHGLTVDETIGVLSWALNNATVEYQTGKPSLEEIKDWIDSGRPIMRGHGAHKTVIDGYDGEYIHVIGPWAATEGRILYEYLDIYDIWIPPADAIGRNDEPEIWIDSDEDGIVDFDETRRFFTDPNNEDTDDDGIDDKQEIQAYTFLPNGTFDSEDIIKPDADEDGYRAELDPDDNDPLVPALLVASFECYPETSWANETISFNATQSSGDIVSYEWNFNAETLISLSLIV